jgi:hypothetical protein
MLEEYQAVTSPTVKKRPVPVAPPGDGVAPPLAVMAWSSPPRGSGWCGKVGMGGWVARWRWVWAGGSGGVCVSLRSFMGGRRARRPPVGRWWCMEGGKTEGGDPYPFCPAAQPLLSLCRASSGFPFFVYGPTVARAFGIFGEFSIWQCFSPR